MELPINKIINGDCIEVLKEFPEKKIHLIFADPPYNIGMKYDTHKDNMGYADYVNWTEKWIDACVRVLRSDGSFYIAIGDEYAAEVVLILKKKGMLIRNWIIWYYTFGQSQKKKFNRSHAHIIYSVKNPKNFTFNADTVRIPSARQIVYNDKRANPKGKIPDDVWKISRVAGTFKERVDGFPCQMPLALLERIVKVSSNRGDIVLDPFVGSGTTAVTSKKLGRKYIGIDISKKYCEDAERRLKGILS